MRTIKFRAWNPELNKMSKPFSFGQILNFWDTNFKSLEPDKEIVMQFIGIHDKNRKEIYEGDLLRYNNWVGEVRFGQGAFYINYKDNTESEFNTMSSQDLEIIGNIHETPELLK